MIAISSLQEARELLREHSVDFPLLILPWGAESFGLPSHVVQDVETFERAVTQALGDSMYTKEPRIHIISRRGWPGSFWKSNRTFNYIVT